MGEFTDFGIEIEKHLTKLGKDIQEFVEKVVPLNHEDKDSFVVKKKDFNNEYLLGLIEDNMGKEKKRKGSWCPVSQYLVHDEHDQMETKTDYFFKGELYGPELKC